MATIQSQIGTYAQVDTYKGGLRTHILPQGAAHAISATSGVIAATTNGTLFTMRLNPNADNDYRVYLNRIYISWTTITAFTTAVTIRSLVAGRSTAHATPSGGTALTPTPKDAVDAVSNISSAAGGDARMATTAALTVTGITWDANPHFTIDMTGQGAAGGNRVVDWNYLDGGGPIVLSPGQLFGIRTGGALDAAGTGNLTVVVEWDEGTF